MGTVTKRLDARSYEVEVEGNQLRRNRLLLRHVPNSSVGETSQQTHCRSECNMGAPNPLAKDTTMQHDENKTPYEQMDGEPVTTSGRPSRNRHMPSHFKDCILY
ncbi:hypothetical protein MTO96_048494 [Rhipicephalus appendiculatus]